jgi:hypothetical protein
MFFFKQILVLSHSMTGRGPMQKKFYVIEPEVAGQIGERSVIDTSVHPPRVNVLEYEFYGWLGDRLLETFPCFIVTIDVAQNLQNSKLTGFVLDTVIITVSYAFEELYPDAVLPKFAWLKPEGEPKFDDVAILTDGRLVLSEEALSLIGRQNLKNATIEVI